MDVPAPTHREVIGVARESLAAGFAIEHALRRTVTDFDNVVAALLAMNTHPLHSDYAYAAQTQFGKPLVVSPFLLSCLVGAVTADLRALGITGMEIADLKFVGPVHPGDTICARSRVAAIGADACTLEVTGAKADGTVFAEFRLVLHFANDSQA